MNDRIADLLEEVADDTDRPARFTTADVVRVGRARRRRRDAAVGGLAAVVAAGLVTTLAVTGPDEAEERPGGFATDPTPSVAPSAEATATSSEPEELSGEDALVYTRCRAAADPPLGDDWRLDARVTDAEGSTATFVSPQGDRWRTCQLGASASAQVVGGPVPLGTSAVNPLQYAGDGIPEYVSLCAKDDASCNDRLYSVALPLREGVASVEVETPAGRTVTPDLGADTYVVRFVEGGTDEPLPVITATLRDAAGDVIVRYDYNDLMR